MTEDEAKGIIKEHLLSIKEMIEDEECIATGEMVANVLKELEEVG